MKLWILLAIAVMLLFWMVSREQFEPTASIKAPPYDDAEKKRMFNMVHERSPSPPYSQLGYQTKLIEQAKKANPRLKNDRPALEIKAGATVARFVQQFYNDIYRPATTPITNEQVDSYVTMSSSAGDMKAIQRDILKTYFVDQSGVGTSGTGYADTLAELGQNAGYLHTGDNETGSSAAEVAAEVAAAGSSVAEVAGAAAAGSSSASSGGRGGSAAGRGGNAAGRGGNAAGRGGSAAGRGGSSAGRGGSSAGRGGSSAGRGGSSAGRGGSSAGGVTPASGTRVFGPEFKGFGKDDGDGNGGRSSRQYPELWGGRSGAAAGAAAAAGDQSSVMLPSTSSLGLDANAIFFPYSRSPGDMDQIPDPYRVSQAWLPSRYSYNKTEPAPFLTDFSAFLK